MTRTMSPRMEYWTKVLALWGVVVLLFIGFGVVRVMWVFAESRSEADAGDPYEPAVPNDLQFILNRVDGDSLHVDKVLHTYRSVRHLLPDHLDAIVFKVRGLDPTVQDAAKLGEHWSRADQLDPVTKRAVDRALSWAASGETPWFPDKGELLSPSVFVYPIGTVFYDNDVNAAEVVFVRPSDNTFFYVSFRS